MLITIARRSSQVSILYLLELGAAHTYVLMFILAAHAYVLMFILGHNISHILNLHWLEANTWCTRYLTAWLCISKRDQGTDGICRPTVNLFAVCRCSTPVLALAQGRTDSRVPQRRAEVEHHPVKGRAAAAHLAQTMLRRDCGFLSRG